MLRQCQLRLIVTGLFIDSAPHLRLIGTVHLASQEPVHLKAGETLKAHIWRCVGPTKVWYEWAVTSPVATHIHNVNGRSYHVGL